MIDNKEPDGTRQPTRRARRRATGVAALAGATLLAAACSGGPAHDSGAGSSGGSGSTLKYSECMRSHGITNFPDPNAQGGLDLSPSDGVNPNSPQFAAAQKACQLAMGTGHQPSAAKQHQIQSQALQFAQCMREHGEPGYPDPSFGPGGLVSQKIDKSSGVDPNSPLYQAAQKACQKYQNLGPGGGGQKVITGGGS